MAGQSFLLNPTLQKSLTRTNVISNNVLVMKLRKRTPLSTWSQNLTASTESGYSSEMSGIGSSVTGEKINSLLCIKFNILIKYGLSVSILKVPVNVKNKVTNKAQGKLHIVSMHL